MSESDDTDILLLIPPDLFHVPPSDSEGHSDSDTCQQRKSRVVSELVHHMQTLESRISAIESKDSPNNTLNLGRRQSSDCITSSRQTMPRTKFSASRQSSLQGTPTKIASSYSLPSTPNTLQKWNYINEKPSYLDSKRDHSLLIKYNHLKSSFSEPLDSQIKRALDGTSPGKESHLSPGALTNLPEVNNFSKEMTKNSKGPSNHAGILDEKNLSEMEQKQNHLDCSMPDTSFSSCDTDRFMTEFKTWNPSFLQDTDSSKVNKIDLTNFQDDGNTSNEKASNNQRVNFLLSESLIETTLPANLNKLETSDGKCQRLLALSDIWNQDEPQEERLRLKLEQEKIQNEHCKQLIQELQKKLLEHQEKIAVAVRVDNEKNAFISKIQTCWKKQRHKLHQLETEREKHLLQVDEYEEQIGRYKQELSKAINLATGYKEKSDNLVEEKVELLKNHADELQNHQLLLQQSEARYQEINIKLEKVLEKNASLDETLKAVERDLNAELMKSSEVKQELTVIHKALDACEAELVILRQEKENLAIMLRDEKGRRNILEKENDSLKKAETLAKDQVQQLAQQQEKQRAELRDVYQKQVDQVVKRKLLEFQTQLDSAEAVFQNEVETKQRAIAECAARKIKSVMDKHQLEIHLVEEKHKEEKKLYEIKLAQAVQKAAILETQLNSYRKSKSQLVEQLYSMLQKQWQQALVIISGSNGENTASFQKIDIDKLFDCPNGENLKFIPEHCSTLCSDPIRPAEQQNTSTKPSQEAQNQSLITLTSNEDSPLTSKKESKGDLKKYIKMILDMQQKDDHQHSSPLANGTPNEINSKWEPISELSIHDTSQYLSPPQKFTFESNHVQPPWK